VGTVGHCWALLGTKWPCYVLRKYPKMIMKWPACPSMRCRPRRWSGRHSRRGGVARADAAGIATKRASLVQIQYRPPATPLARASFAGSSGPPCDQITTGRHWGGMGRRPNATARAMDHRKALKVLIRP
jgi:hypothetical protein